ncbi:MAG: hypothetical protein IPN01_37425 [Deltaproteobacteria bacterium]|nr:hypothetical protein [Deltaproteobacteria bacterium]
MTKRKIEMTWRCSACDTVNKGRHKVCQSCGDPKGADERFEMPQDTAQAATVTDAALLKLAHAGADWRCGRCDAHNSGARASCSQCSAAREADSPSRPPPARPLLRRRDRAPGLFAKRGLWCGRLRHLCAADVRRLAAQGVA